MLWDFVQGECLYENRLAKVEDVKGWKLEGKAKLIFNNERMVLENELDPEKYGDAAHWVFWCPVQFPDEISIEWKFYPLREPGLCMLFFSANGSGGLDLCDPNLPLRDGKYPQYHSGAIDTLHLSYFRHKYPEERAFRTCNLRKSHGFHLVMQGADPLPNVKDAISPYKMKVIKYQGIVQFSINDLLVLNWEDDGISYGPVLGGGKIGFRQMAPMKAAYKDLKVHRVSLKE